MNNVKDDMSTYNPVVAMNDNLKNSVYIEMESNQIEKTVILFEIFEGLKLFYKENPHERVKLSFSFDQNSPKEPAYIKFNCSLHEGKSVVFSDIFHFIHKCISLLDPLKNPFSVFTLSLLQNPQQVTLTLCKDNFDCLFKYYADNFEEKKDWLKRVMNRRDDDIDYVIVDTHPLWGKYPTTVFNKKSHDLWQETKKREGYIKSKYDYKLLEKNIDIIKKQYTSLAENQMMVLKNSYLTIFEEGKIVDCVEMQDCYYLKGVFDKKDNDKDLNAFVKYNSTMLELHHGLKENVFLEMLNK